MTDSKVPLNILNKGGSIHVAREDTVRWGGGGGGRGAGK